MLPRPLELAQRAGYELFVRPYSANLIAIRGPGAPGEWDGLLTLSYRTEAHSGWVTRSWPAATRPGWTYLRSPVNPRGTATIAPGQHRLSHRRGLHRGRPALEQVGVVDVLRDRDTDGVYEPYFSDQGLGLNIHDIRTPDGLAGCIGVSTPHLAELLQVYDVLAARQGVLVSLTVVEAP